MINWQPEGPGGQGDNEKAPLNLPSVPRAWKKPAWYHHQPVSYPHWGALFNHPKVGASPTSLMGEGALVKSKVSTGVFLGGRVSQTRV